MYYKTISKYARAEFVEKRSRFIGYIKPVKTVEEANDFISEIKAKHWDARHNVYAYCLREGNVQRYSDDGEPQGTAGIPVLDVILKEGLKDCVVVVTRYFGGILLGGGGLVRAYSHSCKIAVDAAGVICMDLCDVCEICCDYNFYGKIMSMMSDFAVVIESSDFTDVVTINLIIKDDLFEKFNEKIVDISNGKFSVKKVSQIFSNISE